MFIASDEGFFPERYGASHMSVIFETDLKRKGASPPVSACNLHFLTGQLALCRFK